MRSVKFKILSLLGLLCLADFALAKTEIENELATIFEQYNVEGTLLIHELASGNEFVHNALRAKQRFSPASTFKIPHTLIALSHGLVSKSDKITKSAEVFKWDGQARFLESWNKDHSLRSAFQASCVWCYQSIARQLSQSIYLNELSKIAYGNKELGNDIAQFWLDGSLAISATEQIEFLKRLISNDLPYSDELQKLTKKIMLESIVEASFDNKESGYSLYAKTGWAAGSLNIGWYVGFIEKDEDILVFAMNMHLSDIKQAGLRKKIVMQALRTLDLLN